MNEILIGLTTVLQPFNLVLCVVGTMVGIVFGALPGFSATMAVAVFIPFSYVLEPSGALLLLSGLYCGAVYGGSIPESRERRRLRRRLWKAVPWSEKERVAVRWRPVLLPLLLAESPAPWRCYSWLRF